MLAIVLLLLLLLKARVPVSNKSLPKIDFSKEDQGAWWIKLQGQAFTVMKRVTAGVVITEELLRRKIILDPKRKYLEQEFQKPECSHFPGWYTETSGAGIHLFMTQSLRITRLQEAIRTTKGPAGSSLPEVASAVSACLSHPIFCFLLILPQTHMTWQHTEKLLPTKKKRSKKFGLIQWCESPCQEKMSWCFVFFFSFNFSKIVGGEDLNTSLVNIPGVSGLLLILWAKRNVH